MSLAAAGEPARLRARVGAALKRRFFLRFHVSLILLFTFCVGLLATRVLLWLGMETMWLRYLWTMVAAYCGFLLGVRLWLAYVGAGTMTGAPRAATEPRQGGSGGGFDIPDLGFSGARMPGGVRPPLAGGGGDFAGGGASGVFTDAGAGEGGIADAAGSLASGDAGTGSGGSGGGFSLDLGDADGLVVLLLALLVLVLVVGGAFWLVWAGPEILIEAAFEAMLAGGLVKTLHAGATGWIGRVMWKTLLPFCLVTAAAVAFAKVGQGAYPEARTFREIVRAAWGGEAGADSALVGRDADPQVAQLDARLEELGRVDAAAPAQLRGAAIGVLNERADRLARLGRIDEMLADYGRAAALAQYGDPLVLREQAADAMRLSAYQLGESGRADAAQAGFAALRARFGAAREPGLAWRTAWATNQEAVLREAQAEGSGLDLMRQTAARPVIGADPQLAGQVAEAWRLQGMVFLWRAKRQGNPGSAADLASALACFSEAAARAPAGSGEAAEALAGLAYTRYLGGDSAGAQAALARVPARQRDWTRSVLAQYVENRPLPQDRQFQTLYEQQLKDPDGKG